MKLENSSLDRDLKLLTTNQILPHIQMSISKATNSICIVGPWLDAYFTRKVVDSLANPEIAVSFIVRIDGDDLIDAKTLSALNLAQKNIKKFQARTLKYLHSKVILIDGKIFYLGSTNWYWYSLHESLELTVTGETTFIPEIIAEVESYWEKGNILTSMDLEGYSDYEPIRSKIHFF
jgi:phosphatidylserine/phosphatidylglycerophosphate/cardiolipin synthase-like enzyme